MARPPTTRRGSGRWRALGLRRAAEFEARWKGLDPNEQRALRAIALFPRVPYGAAALAAVGLKKSSANYATGTLLARAELDERDGRVGFVDPLLEAWVRDTQSGEISYEHAGGRAVAGRSELTVDLGALRRNVRTLVRALDGAELWAVVKADGYGHGALDVAARGSEEGACALRRHGREAIALRSELPERPDPRHGPAARARERRARRGWSSPWGPGLFRRGCRCT